MPHALPMRFRSRVTARQRGVALMLVVVALAVATMLAVPFLIAQGTSAAVGRNISDHHRAQAIAESGLELALAYMHQHDDWRDAQAPGTWLADFAFADGSITVQVHNDDPDAPSDELAEVVILTSTGRYNGTSHTARARVEEHESQPGMLEYGLSVAQGVEMTTASRIDAIDSRHDTFNRGVHGSANATVATNATGSNQISLSSNSLINGDVSVGPGSSDPDTVVNRHNNVTGSISKLDEPLNIPPVTLPPNLPPSQGDRDLGGNGQTVFTAGTYRYDDFDIDNNHIVRIQGDVTIVVNEDFAIGDNARIVLDPNATLKLYGQTLVFENNASVNYPLSNNPAAVQIFQTGDDDLEIKNHAVVAGVIFAPNAQMEISNNANLFGGFQGRRVILDNSARFTQDLALTGGGGSGGGGAGDGYRVRWLGTVD